MGEAARFAASVVFGAQSINDEASRFVYVSVTGSSSACVCRWPRHESNANKATADQIKRKLTPRSRVKGSPKKALYGRHDTAATL